VAVALDQERRGCRVDNECHIIIIVCGVRSMTYSPGLLSHNDLRGSGPVPNNLMLAMPLCMPT
jgi:hypothetical protein